LFGENAVYGPPWRRFSKAPMLAQKCMMRQNSETYAQNAPGLPNLAHLALIQINSLGF